MIKPLDLFWEGHLSSLTSPETGQKSKKYCGEAISDSSSSKNIYSGRNS